MINELEKTLLAHKEKIQEIVSDTLQITFKTYFNIDIYKAGNINSKNLKEGIYCETIIRDSENNAVVLISFEKPFLQELANIVYAPNEAGNVESVEACAKEISNIVTARVKTYLNESGYNLTLGIPAIVNTSELLTEDVKVSFFIQDSRLFVDIGFNPAAAIKTNRIDK